METAALRVCRRLSLVGLLCLVVNGVALAGDGPRGAWKDGAWMVGTWYLALDSTPYGLPPGFPLSGLAQFHADGTFQMLDAGDFGQATFTNTQNSQQFGTWRPDGTGGVAATSLFLEADLLTGEVLRWQKVALTLHRTPDRGVVAGTANVSLLECSNMLPLPTALTCPDPIDGADDFMLVPPVDIPIMFKRLGVR